MLLLASLLCLGADLHPRLTPSRLQAIHAQRVEWMKQRVAAPLSGVYQDYRAAELAGPLATPEQVQAARRADVQILFVNGPAAARFREGVMVMGEPRDLAALARLDRVVFSDPRDRKELKREFKQYPDEVFAMAGEPVLGTHDELAFRTSSLHVFARELSESAIEDALASGRNYTASDWLCDPAGFYFVAENNLGAFNIGDTAPMLKGTVVRANLPVAARIVVEHNGTQVVEASGRQLAYEVKEPGDYRLLAWLSLDGEERRWIDANPIHIGKPPILDLPMAPVSPEVEVHRNIVYTAGDPADSNKHMLDLYLPKGKKNFPVMMFLHGGSWRTGDRSMYGPFGNRFAKAGIGVAIPSYRLMPRSPYPAQIEDAAAAFAWVYRNIAQYGGDAARLYLAGHSAGGHLVSLLALNGDYLKKRGVPASAIHGVASISGVYQVGTLKGFENADDDPSPMDHVDAHAPPFLITYCQWDYFGLPKQARDFAATLEKKFVAVLLVYVPREGHISELLATLKAGDPTARALIEFIK